LLGINKNVGYVYVRELKEEGRIRDDEIVRKVLELFEAGCKKKSKLKKKRVKLKDN